MFKIIAFRLGRICIGKKGIYGKLGKKNHFAQGALVYENARIGSCNYFAPYTLVNNAVIGNYCSIGPGCKLGLGEHNTDAVSTCTKIANGNGSMELYNPEKPAIIQNDVWLGANVVVKQGVTIGNGAVIGANAVVTRDIPAYAVAVGIPARVRRYRFPNETIKALLESEWFAEEIPQAKATVSELYSNFFNEQQ